MSDEIVLRVGATRDLGPKPKKTIDHVIMRPKGTGCTHCGREWRFIHDDGLEIDLAIAASDAFLKFHKRCKQKPSAAALMAPKTLTEWEFSWIQGSSSATIFQCFMERLPLGYGQRHEQAAPRDSADFWRCMTMLDLAPPGWRENLAEVARMVPAFAPLVAIWPRLEALCRDGKDSELYAEIKAARGER